MRYMIDHWSGLVRFLDDARIPLSNNHTERAERGPVVGRKNFGGCKSERGLEVAALFYSLLGSAKLAGVEPKAYLRAMAYAAIRGEELLLPHEVARDARFQKGAPVVPLPEDSPQVRSRYENAAQSQPEAVN
jgi:transposase